LFLQVVISLGKAKMFLNRPGVHQLHLGSPHGVQKGPDGLPPAPGRLLLGQDDITFYEDVSVIL
jgi:hypothetical protein